MVLVACTNRNRRRRPGLPNAPGGFCLQGLRRSANGQEMKETTAATVVSPAALLAPVATLPASEPPAAPESTAATDATDATKPAQTATIVDPAELVDETASLPPGKGKGNRTLDDYAKLDWTKTNAELAKLAGVSRQRIAQIRQDLKDREEREALAATESEIGGLPPDSAAPGSATQAQAATTASEVTPAVDYKLMAETVFGMSTGLATMIIGPEWQPRTLTAPDGTKVDEKAAVVEALRVYFQSKQFQDLPPGYMLCFVVASYCAPRFAVPNTRTKFQLTWTWIKVKVGGWFNRRKTFVPRIVNHATPVKQESQPQ